MIGLMFVAIRVATWAMKLTIGGMIAMVALMIWCGLAVFLVLPGDKRGLRRSMRQTSRSASRALRMAL